MERTVTGVTATEAAEIIGCTRAAVYQLVHKGQLPKAQKHQRGGIDREAVEQLAVERWKPGHAYWASNTEAAEILGVSRQRVAQLAREGRLPYRETADGKRRLFRRPQLEVITNALLARYRWDQSYPFSLERRVPVQHPEPPGGSR